MASRSAACPAWAAIDAKAVIPDCTFVIHDGNGHLGAVSDERLPRDANFGAGRHDGPIQPHFGTDASRHRW
jgi:hypothetical protein